MYSSFISSKIDDYNSSVYYENPNYILNAIRKIRCYKEYGCNVTIDNVSRNISSFFSWLEEEDYILKSPMKRIHKIKTKKIVKNTISDEEIEKLRDNCKEKETWL